MRLAASEKENRFKAAQRLFIVTVLNGSYESSVEAIQTLVYQAQTVREKQLFARSHEKWNGVKRVFEKIKPHIATEEVISLYSSSSAVSRRR